MSSTQAIRHERRAARVAQERAQKTETIMATVMLILAILAFAAAGTIDYQDQQAQASYWAEQGVTLQGW